MNRPTRPASAFLRLLGGRWTLPVLSHLAEADCRYQELLDAAEGVSHKVLTETLRRAERDGLVTRHLDADRVESTMVYRLTPLGRNLEDPPLLPGPVGRQELVHRPNRPTSLGQTNR